MNFLGVLIKNNLKISFVNSNFYSLTIAEAYTIKNPKGAIKKVQAVIPYWEQYMQQANIPEDITGIILGDFKLLF